jgi:hypothetical protein
VCVLPFPPTTDNSRHAEGGGGGSVVVGPGLFLFRTPSAEAVVVVMEDGHDTTSSPRLRFCGGGGRRCGCRRDGTGRDQPPRVSTSSRDYGVEEDGIEMTEDGSSNKLGMITKI